jgi:hypothetical protein
MHKTTLQEAQEKIVATAIRVEVNQETDDYFLVFQKTEPQLKKRIKEDWMQDIDLLLIGKNLVESK